MNHYLNLLLFLFLSNVLWAQIPDRPATVVYVSDFGELLTDEDESQLSVQLRAVDKNSTAQIIVVTVEYLEGESIENYANKLFNKWGIGDATNNNGVLLLISKRNREMRIEVGYGLEAKLTDYLAKSIVNKQLKPAFKKDQYFEGIQAALERMEEIVNAKQIFPNLEPNPNTVGQQSIILKNEYSKGRCLPETAFNEEQLAQIEEELKQFKQEKGTKLFVTIDACHEHSKFDHTGTGGAYTYIQDKYSEVEANQTIYVYLEYISIDRIKLLQRVFLGREQLSISEIMGEDAPAFLDQIDEEVTLAGQVILFKEIGNVILDKQANDRLISYLFIGAIASGLLFILFMILRSRRKDVLKTLAQLEDDSFWAELEDVYDVEQVQNMRKKLLKAYHNEYTGYTRYTMIYPEIQKLQDNPATYLEKQPDDQLEDYVNFLQKMEDKVASAHYFYLIKLLNQEAIYFKERQNNLTKTDKERYAKLKSMLDATWGLYPNECTCTYWKIYTHIQSRLTTWESKNAKDIYKDPATFEKRKEAFLAKFNMHTILGDLDKIRELRQELWAIDLELAWNKASEQLEYFREEALLEMLPSLEPYKTFSDRKGFYALEVAKDDKENLYEFISLLKSEKTYFESLVEENWTEKDKMRYQDLLTHYKAALTRPFERLYLSVDYYKDQAAKYDIGADFWENYSRFLTAAQLRQTRKEYDRALALVKARGEQPEDLKDFYQHYIYVLELDSVKLFNIYTSNSRSYGSYSSSSSSSWSSSSSSSWSSSSSSSWSSSSSSSYSDSSWGGGSSGGGGASGSW
ncbi:MAG: TPM domain-containing protein [Saprospiraceae bacterium]|nr:TPM domain-containing protein [Saprospiraceae bacterium]